MDPHDTASAVQDAVIRVRAAWAAGQRPDLRPLLAHAADDIDSALEIVSADAEERWSRGLPATVEHYGAACPEIVARREVCRALLTYELVHRDDRHEPGIRERLKAGRPHLAEEVDLVVDLFQTLSGELEPAADGHAAPVAAAGASLGKYHLVERLGAGSFGEVWRAWDADLERYIALKLLRPPRDQEQSAGLRRLMAEAQAAAALDHENVVRVHAAGRAGEAGPYFIDTQLAGDAAPTADDPRAVAIAQPLDRLGARDGRPALSPRRAAEIVERACRGVAAAHARAITHRDLKPGNILLTPSGRVLVADFGLAAPEAPVAADGGPTATVSLDTPSGRLVGTPAYMAPEQARGEPATPLTDVYALGATLRFLLTGDHPFHPSGSFHPDERLDVVEQVKRAEPRPIPPEAPPALAAICRRAMARDPRHRYISADQMAADLRAWLDDRPTLALPPGALGRARLWSRRHAAGAAVGAAAAILIIAATAAYIVSIRAERQRAVAAERDAREALARAQVEADKAAAVRDFLESMLGSANPRAAGRDATVHEVLDAASARAAAELAGSPEVYAAVRATVGNTYRALGDYDQAAPHLDAALATRQQLLGPDHPETLGSSEQLALLWHETGQLERAEAALRQALDARRRTQGPDHPATLQSMAFLGNVLQDRGDRAGAAELFRAAHEGRQRILGEDHPDTLVSLNDLAGALLLSGQAAEAEPLLRRALDAQARRLGPDHPDTLVSVNDLAMALKTQGRLAEAEPFYRRAVEGLAARFGEGHLDTLVAMNNLAGLLRGLGRHDEAADTYQRLIQAADRSLGPDHYLPHVARGGYGLCLDAMGRHEQAEAAMLASHDGLQRTLGAAHPYTAGIRRILTTFYESRGRPDLAERYREP